MATTYSIYRKDNGGTAALVKDATDLMAAIKKAIDNTYLGSGEKEQAMNALIQRGYYTIGYSDTQIFIEENE